MIVSTHIEADGHDLIAWISLVEMRALSYIIYRLQIEAMHASSTLHRLCRGSEDPEVLLSDLRHVGDNVHS